MVKVLLASDYPLFSHGVRAVLAAHPGYEIVGEAADPTEVVALATALNPEVVLCDQSVAGIDPLELTRRLRLNVPNSGVVIISEIDDEEYLFEAVKAGAAAHLLRRAGPDALVTTLERVARGEHLIDEHVLTRPRIASRVLHQFNRFGESAPAAGAPIFAPLSPREIEILELISQGNSNKQIARILSISDQTVKNHITSILKKLAVNDRTEAVVYSIRQGWIRMEPLPG